MKVQLTGENKVKISWNKVSGASGYQVFYKKSKSKTWSSKGNYKTTYVNLSKLSRGTKYDFMVKSYKTVNGKKYFTDSKVVSLYTLNSISGVKVKRHNASKIQISWKNINGESGYQISQSTKKNKTKVVKTWKTTTGKSYKISAKKGKKYYYKVRAYKVENGKKIYGSWSKVVRF